LIRIVVVVNRQRHLLEVVGALHPRRCLADLLDGGEEQADEDGNDGDDDEQLDQRKCQSTAGRELTHWCPPKKTRTNDKGKPTDSG